MKPIRTWIMIADAGSAKLYENSGPGSGLVEISGGNFKAPEKSGFDDQQGRTFNSVGTMRHKHEPHFSEDQSFAKTLAGELEVLECEGRFDRIILCAAPETLGALRAQLPKSVSTKIHAEVPKNLTKIPQIELAGHFENVLAV